MEPGAKFKIREEKLLSFTLKRGDVRKKKIHREINISFSVITKQSPHSNYHPFLFE